MPAETVTLSFVSMTTTGPSPRSDAVLEVAAVRLSGGKELARLSELANPGEIPLAVQKVTGLDARHIAGRPGPKEVLDKLAAFLSGDTVVVHGAEEFVGFLEAAGYNPPRLILDNHLLARVVRPSANNYSLPALAKLLSMETPKSHRALDLARLLAGVWQRLQEEARALPVPVLEALQRVATVAECTLAEPLSEIANEKEGFRLSTADRAPNLEVVFKDFGELFAEPQDHKAPEPSDEPIDTEKVCAMFAPGGLIARRLPGYEHREEQTTMAREVCEAFNTPHHLMFEAGTGTGKSMAYLVAAIAWARQNEDKLIVSTNTKNLQEQLYHKDLPFLRELFGDRFKAALLKGRTNYLCVRRFLHTVRYFERELADTAEMKALLPVITWAARTETGDMAECSGLMMDPSALSLLPRVTSTGDECAGRACPARDQCFLRRARTLAQLADLVVVNHALVFAEVGLDQPYLPLNRCIIFDEAQNLEDVATRALTVTADTLSFFRVTNRLWRAHRDGTGSGMIASVMAEADRRLADKGPLSRQTVHDLAQGVVERIDEVVAASRDSFDTLAEPFESVPFSEDQILLRDCRPRVGVDTSTGKESKELAKSVERLGGRIEALAEGLELNEERMRGAAQLALDLRAQVTRLKEAMGALEFTLKQEDAGYVYWLGRTRRGMQAFHSLHAAPLEVGKRISSFFLEGKRCSVFTSATLRVNGQFDYMRQRLGAQDMTEQQLKCAAVGSSFDFDRQTLVCVPTFLPEAGGVRDEMFDQELSSFLIELLEATSGRALVLFTSYSLLDAVYRVVKGPLEKAGIPVLAQGHSGSREAITALFKEMVGSVVLGTQSFWEGVDVPGEALSCLVVTKLPFQAMGDPLVQGRMEYLTAQGQEPFQHYTLPEAVISFRQGFGRLIRNRTDRGVVVVTDRRLVTKAYGRAFLRDIPTGHHVFKERAPLIAAVKRFFGRPH